MSKKVLVTGADGFIGSHLVQMLMQKGYSVRALCQYNSFGSWGWLDTIDEQEKKNIDVILGDIRDSTLVAKAVKDCDSVYHLAALIAIPYSYIAPSSYIETNITGTLNVLEACKNEGISKLIHTSTSETYGSAQYVPIDEKHPMVGQSPYAATKIGADQLAMSYWTSFEVPVAIIRPFNTYGPRQSARAVIPTIISQVLNNTESIKIGALSPTRDFNYVKDTCNAFICVAESDRTKGRVVNSASNFEISIGETIQIIMEEVGKELKVISEEERMRPTNSEVNRLYGDNTLIKEITNWRPLYEKKEGFRRGIRETIEWFKKPENLTNYKSNIYTI